MNIKLTNNNIEKIYNTYYNQIFKYVFSRTYNYELSRDITQEVFLRLLETKEKEKNNVKSWLFTVATRIIIDNERKEITKYKLHDKSINKDISYEHKFDYKSFFININNILNILTKKQKKVIELKYINNMDFCEIKDITNYSKERIHGLLNRGIKKIRLSISRTFD